MTWNRSLSFGFGLTLTGLALVLLAAFTYNLDLEVPLLFSLTSTTDPKPETILEVSPLGIPILALLVSVLLHYATQLITKTRKNVRRAP